MHLHILGICGTFMGSLAVLARAQGHKVTGCDANVYPPMSTQLEALGIHLHEGYGPESLAQQPDVVVVGNAMSRGVPVVEALLNSGIPYVSGPQWLAENILQGQHVLALSGTHGKTTTSSMLAWVLADNKLNPGFLIGGVPGNFEFSAQLGDGQYFVIEADEYDSAFFDKRSKFVHYRPTTLVINNIEFDHADIFDDLAAIQKQFHHLVRTVPSEGSIISPITDDNINTVLDSGCWSNRVYTGVGGAWQAELIKPDGTQFEIYYQGNSQGIVSWSQMGAHNIQNALVTIAAATDVGVDAAAAIDSLCRFKGVKRRMELRANCGGVRIYDDFAHHPTAINTTLAGLRANVGAEKIIAVLEPRSNTMKMGVHDNSLADSVALADEVFWFVEEDSHLRHNLPSDHHCIADFDELIDNVVKCCVTPSHVLVMSNGGFGGIHQRLIDAIGDC